MSLTALQIQAEVVLRVGPVMVDAGLYAPDAATGMIPAVVAGLRRGAAEVGVALTNPLAFADADAANLTTFAAERVADEAERFVLGMTVLNWYRVLQQYREPVETSPDMGGWLAEQKSSIKARIAQLNAALAGPYREPSDPMVIVSPSRSGRWPAADACLPAAFCWDRFPWSEGYYSPWSYWGGCP